MGDNQNNLKSDKRDLVNIILFSTLLYSSLMVTGLSAKYSTVNNSEFTGKPNTHIDINRSISSTDPTYFNSKFKDMPSTQADYVAPSFDKE